MGWTTMSPEEQHLFVMATPSSAPQGNTAATQRCLSFVGDDDECAKPKRAAETPGSESH